MADQRSDYYAVLGVPRTASVQDIRRAYRKAALECHPDRFPDDTAQAARFRLVTEAYDALSDPRQRERYDRGGAVFFGASMAREFIRREAAVFYRDHLRNIGAAAARTTQEGGSK